MSEGLIDFFERNKEDLEHVAFKALKDGLRPERILAVALSANDPAFRNFMGDFNVIAERIEPNLDWPRIRASDAKVILTFVTVPETFEILHSISDNYGSFLEAPLPPNSARALLLTNGLVAGRLIYPFPHFKGG